MSANESEEPRRPTNFQGVVDDEGNVTITVPLWLQRLGEVADRLVFIARVPIIWIVAVLLGVPVTAATIDAFYVDLSVFREFGVLPENPSPLFDVFLDLQQKGPVAVILDDFLYRTVLLPLAVRIFNAGFGVLTEIVSGLFGSDFAVGIAEGSTIGVLDVPFAVSAPGVNAITGTTLAVIDAIQGVNLSLAQGLEPLGLAAPTVVTAVWVAEVAAVAWGMWVLFSTIDLPGLNVKGLLLSITRPVRNFIAGVLR